MTNKEARILLEKTKPTDNSAMSIMLREALNMVIKALEQEPCEDAVSRQAAIDAMYALCDTGETLKENPWRDNPHIDAITDALDNLQPVTPQPKTERCKWIRYDYRTICPKNHDIDNPYWRIPENTEHLKYCPYCGKEVEVTK